MDGMGELLALGVNGCAGAQKIETVVINQKLNFTTKRMKVSHFAQVFGSDNASCIEWVNDGDLCAFA